MRDTRSEHRVELALDVEASPGTVWRILTTPDLFAMWMQAAVDFGPDEGSPFRAHFPAFRTVVTGEIVTLDPDARHLELTWGVESGPQQGVFPPGSSRVVFRVLESEAGCRVELEHSRLPSVELAREHRQGWHFHLDRLALRANRADLESGLERTLSEWFAAWNDSDEATRLATLVACCAEGVEFRDDWTSLRGTEALSAHIGMYFNYVPGWMLERTGEVRICRGEALVGWRSAGPDGQSVTGTNHVRADCDGTIRRVTGFQAGVR